MMIPRPMHLGFALAFGLLAGCGRPTNPVHAWPERSDAERVRSADISILFVGNSHTAMPDMPELIAEMLRYLKPGRTVYTFYIGVAFLEDAGPSEAYREEIESRKWTNVVLQAQKISVSGRHEYPREGGLDVARRAKASGASVCFYPEWGLKGVAGDGMKQEKVYREMAREVGVGVAPVARAWDLALAGRPELELHLSDGNHQAELGAFLTACVLVGRLTGDDATALAAFPYPAASEADRHYLAGIAAKALAE